IIEKLEYKEIEKKDGEKRYELIINESANKAFREQAEGKFSLRFILRSAITLVPVLLIFVSYIVLEKKYIIDEEMYEKMIATIAERKKTTQRAT
ncbi:MAG: hypothetical protein WCZ85_02755, partial [Bacilli bacterium]